MAEKLEQYLGTGRRKNAIARAYLRPGKGKMVINGDDAKKYIGNRPTLQGMIEAPLRETQMLSKFDVIINVVGGGVTGQAGAMRHAISRALLVASPGTRPVLKKAGFLTRDPRAVERKKPGLHKARKASQYSKR
ncbi:30S ribosomal protein S9 [bacterium]|nr:30S ribosomal protein S9 [bacterium]